MTTQYFYITTEHPKIVKHEDGVTAVYVLGQGWVADQSWFDRIFFNDFTEFEEMTEREAMMFISGLTAA